MDNPRGRGLYGVERIREDGWYVWHGWCIFWFDAINDCLPNVLPYYLNGTFLDAGGGNFPIFYGRYVFSSVGFAPVVTKRIRHTKEPSSYNDICHGDCVQLIDHTWLHLINGSNCARIPGKEALVNRMIEGMERLYEVVKGGEKA